VLLLVSDNYCTDVMDAGVRQCWDRFSALNVPRDSKTIMSKARRNGHEKSVSVKDV